MLNYEIKKRIEDPSIYYDFTIFKSNLNISIVLEPEDLDNLIKDFKEVLSCLNKRQ